MSCNSEFKDLAFCETKERKEEGREERKCERDKHGTICIFFATFNLVSCHNPCTLLQSDVRLPLLISLHKSYLDAIMNLTSLRIRAQLLPH